MPDTTNQLAKPKAYLKDMKKNWMSHNFLLNSEKTGIIVLAKHIRDSLFNSRVNLEVIALASIITIKKPWYYL